MDVKARFVALHNDGKVEYVKENKAGRLYLVDNKNDATVYTFKRFTSVYSENSIFTYLKENNKDKDISFKVDFLDVIV